MKNAKILVLGLAYKPDVDDVRESPSIDLVEKFERLGAKVDYHDPHVPQTHKMRHHNLQMKSVGLDAKSVAAYDVVVISTNHAKVDYALIGMNAKLIVDTRNAMKGVVDRANILKA